MAGAATGIPPYYLTFDQPLGDETKPVGLLLGAMVSGKTLVTLPPPRGLSFVGITGAGDDRTFVTDAGRGPSAAAGALTQSRSWYRVRVTGAGARVRLTTARHTFAWVGNHALAYEASVPTGSHESAYGVLVLELSHPDGPILASSRLAITLAHVSTQGPPTAPARPPFSCGPGLPGGPTVVGGDGTSFVCAGSGASTATLPDASTAKMPRLWCASDTPAWNTVAFGRGIVTPQFGVFSHGAFRPLPIPMLKPGNTWWQGFLMDRVAW